MYAYMQFSRDILGVKKNILGEQTLKWKNANFTVYCIF